MLPLPSQSTQQVLSLLQWQHTCSAQQLQQRCQCSLVSGTLCINSKYLHTNIYETRASVQTLTNVRKANIPKASKATKVCVL